MLNASTSEDFSAACMWTTVKQEPPRSLALFPFRSQDERHHQPQTEDALVLAQLCVLFHRRRAGTRQHPQSPAFLHLQSEERNRRFRATPPRLNSVPSSVQVITERAENVSSVESDSDSDHGRKKRQAFLDMLLKTTDEDGNKMSHQDIQEEVDTFMFRVGGHGGQDERLGSELNVVFRHHAGTRHHGGVHELGPASSGFPPRGAKQTPSGAPGSVR